MNQYCSTPSLAPRLRSIAAALALLSLVAVPPAHAADKKAPPPKSATEYPANDTHAAEHVTIAIDPCDRERDCSFFRLPYVNHSMIPVRVIITNDSDAPLSLDDVRIQFISANNDKLPAADLEDINRRMFTFKSTQPTTIPMTQIAIHHPAPIDKKVIEDDKDFGFQSTTVNPSQSQPRVRPTRSIQVGSDRQRPDSTRASHAPATANPMRSP